MTIIRGMTESIENSEIFQNALINSGYKTTPISEISKILRDMEQHIMEETGLSEEELNNALAKLKDLVGEEEASKLKVFEIIDWIKAF
jgi:predicted ATPase